MAVVAPVEQVEQALAPMQTMLGADGYELSVALDEGTLRLTVGATPDACADCLVPKELFATIAVSMLGDGGIAADAADLDLRYPTDP